MKVKNVIAHPSYNPRTIDNDIALLELSVPVTYNRWVKPACLPSEDVEGKPNQYCYITGEISNSSFRNCSRIPCVESRNEFIFLRSGSLFKAEGGKVATPL